MSVRLEEIDPRYVELEAQRREIAWRRGAAPRELERRHRGSGGLATAAPPRRSACGSTTRCAG
jgi:hypothetical protein